MSIIVYRAGRAAMRCWCEVFLCGEDRGHLAAVAELALDEISRVERMLSRFDPASEVFRLNHAAVGVPIRVSPELFAILIDCRDWWSRTDGMFDVTVGSAAKPGIFLNAGLLPLTGVPPTSPLAVARHPKQTPGLERWNAIRFDAANCTITRMVGDITFDFGGYGKGYAIDRALAITQQHGITAACLHAGTSSVVASGPPPDAAGWPIAIRHADEESRTVAEWCLHHAGVSTSAVPLSPSQRDIVDPTQNAASSHPASCTVLAATATIAEVWSTALLIRGDELPTRTDVRRVFWQRYVDGLWTIATRP